MNISDTMNITDMMTMDSVVITPQLTAAEVAKIFLENDLDNAQVTDANGELLGYVNQNHLMHLIAGGLSPHTPVEKIMSTSLEPVKKDDIQAEVSNGYPYHSFSNSGSGQNTTRYKALLSKYEELITCLNSMYNPVISVDQNENISIYNSAAEKVFGVKAENAVGKNIVELFGISNLADVIKTEQTQPAQKVWRGGKTFLSNLTPIFRKGKINGAVAVLQEISDLENVIKELNFSKQLNKELDAIFESSYDGLYVTDGEGNTLRLNKGFERITGLSASKCIGRNMADLVNEGLYSRSGTLLALKQRQRVTISLQTITGKTVLVTSNPIFDNNDKIVLVVTNVRDITELNELQRKLEHVKDLSRFYQNELLQLKLQNSKQLIVHSRKMTELVNLVIRVAAVDSTVLIQGESGVGKELIADIMHANSARKNGPLIKVNCGAIPENLLESELFGYEPGAFSGASKNGKAGMFELAGGGVLFLDEIGDMPLNLQVKLLRAIQDMEINRIGGIKPIKVDLRIFAGTNHNLREMAANGQFRQDLYYRLNVVPIVVPPLRERKEDIPVLCRYFLETFNRKYNMNKRLLAKTISYFMEYNWPGNVRELENLIERLVVTTLDDDISINDLPACLKTSISTIEDTILPLKSAVENTERQMLQNAFSRYKSTYEVAEVLQINQSTVVRKAAKYGITRT